MKSRAVRSLALAALIAAAMNGQDTKYPPQGQQFPGPPAKTDTAEWLSEMRRYREERRVRAGLTGEIYRRPELKWAQSSFMQPQAMVEDRYLYDPVARRYTVGRYLDDLEARYGGIDSVLLWPVYPNIGIDNRNQFDLLRDMPGGLPALRRMVDDFHKRGVRVLFPNMPWDVGTRPEPLGKPETIAALLAEIGADGVNGDTYGGVPRTFRTASDATGHPLVFEPEGYPDSDEMLNWDSMSWGYWKYPFVPMVSRGKWLETRHMVNVCDRWNKSKNDNLQAAFFNGVGYETWENIWGIWNGITERDAEAIRRVAKIERRFAEYLVSADWEPHTNTLQYGIFASKWPNGGRSLWTIVNRAVYNIDGPQLEVPANPSMLGITGIDPLQIGSFSFASSYEWSGFRVDDVHLHYYLFLAFTLLVIFVSRRLEDSRIGRAWVAIREDEVAASAMGINTRNIKLLAFAMGATFGGISGGLFAGFQGFVSPESFSLMESIMVLCMVVLGGMGNVGGVVLGGVLLVVLPELFRNAAGPVQQALLGRVVVDPESLRMLMFGLALILVMLWRPAGLWPSSQRRREFDAQDSVLQQEQETVYDASK